ncbi:MAG: ATP-binding protein [Anaerolineae bacterium]|nr:ATP-binding protein [Anaerolineae bacterium]
MPTTSVPSNGHPPDGLATMRPALKLDHRLMDSLPQAMSVTDAQGRYRYVNPAFEVLLGYPREALIGRRTSFDIVYPPDLERLKELRARQIRGESREYEIRAVRADGCVIDVLVQNARLMQDDGSIDLVFTITDVTERNVREAELRRRNMLLEALNRTALAIASQQFNLKEVLETIVHRALEMCKADNGFLYLADLDKRELLPTVQVGGYDAPQFWAYKPRYGHGLNGTVWATGQTFVIDDYQTWPYRTTNTFVKHHATVGVAMMLGKQVLGILGLSHNDPQRRFSKDEVKSLERIASLAALVVNNARLYQSVTQARDQAVKASRAKSDFIAVISHELRTPLNVILGMAELLLDTPLSSDQREFAGLIDTSGKSLLEIINDILDFSKGESGKISLVRERFELNAAISRVVAMLMPKAHEKNLSFETVTSPDVPAFLLGDEARLRQILVNLLNNAIKFTDVGRVRMRVTRVDTTQADCEAANQASDGVLPAAYTILLRFEIADTGIGVSRADQPKLFQPFMQADYSLTRQYGGTGLGLAISKQLTELMDGQIGMCSDGVNGRGSTFWFTAKFGLPN